MEMSSEWETMKREILQNAILLRKFSPVMGLFDALVAELPSRSRPPNVKVAESLRDKYELYDRFRAQLFDEPDGYVWEYMREDPETFEKRSVEIKLFLNEMADKHAYVMKSLKNIAGFDDVNQMRRIEKLGKDVEYLLLCIQGDGCSTQTISHVGLLVMFGGVDAERGALEEWWLRKKTFWTCNDCFNCHWVEGRDFHLPQDLEKFAAEVGWHGLESPPIHK